MFKEEKMEEMNTFPIGLENFRSNCFLNTALQIILNLVPYNDLLLQCLETNPDKVPSPVREWTFLYLELYLGLRKQNYRVLSPKNLYRYLVKKNYITNGHQGDYHEIFLQLIDQLSRAQRALKLSPTFDDLVTINIQKTIKCPNPNCLSENKTTDLISSIPIIDSDLNRSLLALNEITELNDYKCEKCSFSGDFHIESQVKELPRLLYFHHNHKNPRPIKFTENYQLTINSRTINYRLYMLVYHCGSQRTGHYYLHLYQQPRDIGTKPIVYYINDETVNLYQGFPKEYDLVSLLFLLN